MGGFILRYDRMEVMTKDVMNYEIRYSCFDFDFLIPNKQHFYLLNPDKSIFVL